MRELPRIAQAADLDARFAEAVEAREGLRETDKKDTRLLCRLIRMCWSFRPILRR
jgi:hypothetical protein